MGKAHRNKTLKVWGHKFRGLFNNIKIIEIILT
jgi:hypothetical protein